MSRKATDWAWSMTLRPTLKIVLLAMADSANEQFICSPSFELLSSETSLDKQTVKCAIDNLIKQNVLNEVFPAHPVRKFKLVVNLWGRAA